MKARGTLIPNETFGKTHKAEKAEKGYFLLPLGKLTIFTGSKNNKEVTSILLKHVSSTENLKKLKSAKN